MNLNIENLVRSGVLLVVGLPLTLSLGNLVGVTARLATETGTDPTASAQASLKSDLAGPCLRYMLSKDDSALEREAKNAIDKVVGGPVDYGSTCNWVL